jgi:peptidoglycan/LPS O-acetylase OafA/YrhL
MKLRYYKSLDGVRAVAALFVMFAHFFAQYYPIHPGWEIMKIFAQIGVTMFFVLSGFLITRILLVEKQHSNYFRNFYIKRTLRIFPLYYFFLLFYYFGWPLISGEKTIALNDQVYFWIYLQNFAMTFHWGGSGPEYYWSLAVEEHFYLFWPLIVLLLSRKSLKRFAIFICIFAIALRYLMADKGFDVYYFTFTRFDSLAMGAFLATLETDAGLTQKLRKNFSFLLFLSILLMLFLSKFSGDGSTWIQVIKYSIFSITFLCVIAIVISVSQRSIFNQVLSAPFLIYSGRISYGLYVWHPVVFSLTSKLFRLSIVPLFLISFGAAYLIASLSYYLLEKRFLNWKKYFNESRRRAKLDLQAESF